MNREQRFLSALKDIFIGAPVEGQSGYINLMRTKATYFEQGVFPRLMADIDAALRPFPKFREELFDRLYTFFHRYFSESGSIYYRYTPLHERVYEQVYTDDRDVMLFWKTHMLYYVKTDRLFRSMETEVDGFRFAFDVSTLEHKRANEKRALVFEFKEWPADGALVFTVTYSERGRKTRMNDVRRAIKDALGLPRYTDAVPAEETLERAFRLFERQSEVDYFINKDARKFLREQFDLWLYQYVFEPEQQAGTVWTQTRISQLQTLKDIAYKIIDFIAQFEDELVKIWNKPKFVLDSHYVITLDRIAAQDGGPALLECFLAHPGMEAQVQEWRDLGMVGEDFTPAQVWETDLLGRCLHPRYQYLPLDTRHFPDLEPALLALFDHPSTGSGQGIDQELDGWLVHSENYQALNTLLPKFRERVQCIYIDPPYNAAESEILYENRFKHSSWLCLFENRIVIARDFLSRDGIQCVTIDDYEAHHLKTLLDDIFGYDNYLATVAIRNNPSGRSTTKGFAINHEYALFYSRDLQASKVGRLPHTERQQERYDQIDEHGNRFEWENLRKSARGSRRSDRPKQFYPIYYDPKTQKLRIPSMEWQDANNAWKILEQPLDSEIAIWPLDNRATERVWSYGADRVTREANLMKVEARDGKFEIYKRKYLQQEGVLPRTWWDKPSYSARDSGTRTLKDLTGTLGVFDFPKSVYAVADVLLVCSATNHSMVLDYFAGSGTTAHAVINLNREDGGRRRYILVEMADYFDTVLLPRIKKVVFSDKWKDGQAQPDGQGVSHFVKYFALEQYEDVLRRAHYAPAEPLFVQADPYSQYVFLRDPKLLDNAATGEQVMEIDPEKDQVRVDLSKLYENIDLAETLSCVAGKWIRRLYPDPDDPSRAGVVEFEDGSTVDLNNPPWELAKPLIWW